MLHNLGLYKEELSAAESYHQSGHFSSEQRQYYSAINAYNSAININPNHAVAYNDRGIAYTEIGLSELAVKDFSRAIKLDPNLAIAYCNRAGAYLHKGEKELALADYRKAIALDDQMIWTYLGKTKEEQVIQDKLMAEGIFPVGYEPYERKKGNFFVSGLKNAFLFRLVAPAVSASGNNSEKQYPLVPRKFKKD